MKKIPQKHLPYYVVLEALQGTKGCAFCVLEMEAMHHYIDTLLYEHVNDPRVRSNLARSRGYCSRHAHLLLSFQDGLGTAILARSLLGDFLGSIEQLGRRAARHPDRGVSGEWINHRNCPACRNQTETRTRRAETLIAWYEEPELRDAYERSPGPCIPHFAHLLVLTRGEGVCRWLISTQKEKCANLLREIDEFVCKCDYRRSAEGFGAEADSWIRAIETLVGKTGVF